MTNRVFNKARRSPVSWPAADVFGKISRISAPYRMVNFRMKLYGYPPLKRKGIFNIRVEARFTAFSGRTRCPRATSIRPTGKEPPGTEESPFQIPAWPVRIPAKGGMTALPYWWQGVEPQNRSPAAIFPLFLTDHFPGHLIHDRIRAA